MVIRMDFLPRVICSCPSTNNIRLSRYGDSWQDDDLAAPCGMGEGGHRAARAMAARPGAVGLLCPNVPEEYGGFGGDWLYNVVVIEEMARAGHYRAGLHDPFGDGGALHPGLGQRGDQAALAAEAWSPER